MLCSSWAEYIPWAWYITVLHMLPKLLCDHIRHGANDYRHATESRTPRQHWLVSQCVQRRLAQERIHVTRQGISAFLRRYRNTGSVARKQRRRWYGKVADRQEIVHQLYLDNDELSAVDVQRILRDDHGIVASLTTVKRCRQRLGWERCRPKYCQFVKRVNQEKRLRFCRDLVDAQGTVQDNFDDCIFTDECTVQLFPNTSLCFTNKQAGVERRPKPTVKHPTKVHVWGGILARGSTRVLVLEGRMDARFYVDNILTDGLTPIAFH